MVGDNIASVFLPILSTIVHPNYRRNDKLSKHNIGLIEIDLAKLPKDIRLRPIKIKIQPTLTKKNKSQIYGTWVPHIHWLGLR